MSNPNDSQDKKIIIDEDWKSQVQAEKEELQRKQRSQAADPPKATAAEAGSLPAPTFTFLITTLGLQTMAALGQIPNPLSGKTEVALAQAKHLIDMLQMLEEKTQGNRTAEESAVLDDLLHEARLTYVARVQQPAESGSN